MEGFEDPFNRRTFPWGSEDKELTDWFARLGNLRKTSPALRRGELCWLVGEGDVLAFVREEGNEAVLCACNRGAEGAQLPLPHDRWSVALGEGAVEGSALRLPPCSAMVLKQHS